LPVTQPIGEPKRQAAVEPAAVETQTMPRLPIG
jgi:hypothetical protein